MIDGNMARFRNQRGCLRGVLLIWRPPCDNLSEVRSQILDVGAPPHQWPLNSRRTEGETLMKRTNALVLGLPGSLAAVLAAGFSGSATAEGSAVPGNDLDPIAISDRTGGALSPESISRFLSLSRDAQAKAMHAVGIDDLGGALTDPKVQRYLLGSWLREAGKGSEGAELMITSGLMDVQSAIHLLDEVAADDEPSADEVVDTMLATGLSEAEARDRARLIDRAVLLRPLLRRFDAGYLYLIAGTDGLEYATKQPANVKETLADIPFAINVVESRYSETDLNSAMDRVAMALESRFAKGDVVYVWPDKLGQTIQVEAVSSERDRVQAELSTLEVGVPLTVVASGSVFTEEVTFRGGISASGCTWGYATTNSQLLTAGHCPSSQNYAGTVQPYVAGSEINSGDLDSQRHNIAPAAGAVLENSVWLGGSTYRDITSVRAYAAMDLMDTSCHRGATTGYTCGHIQTLTGAQAVGGGTQVPHSVGSALNSGGGDSGGPWLSGNTALGTHEGSNASSSSMPDINASWIVAEFIQNHYGIAIQTK